jgi:hypothetical protein
MKFHLQWENKNQEILYLLASLILGYLVAQYSIQQRMYKRFWIPFIGFSLFFYFFFRILSNSSNPLFSFFQENFTNGLDEEEFFQELGEISGEVSGEVLVEVSGEVPVEISGEVSGEVSGAEVSGEVSGDEISGHIHPKPRPHPSEISGMSGGGGGKIIPSEISGQESNQNQISIDGPTTGNAYGPLNINVSYKTIGCEDGDGQHTPRCNIKNPYVHEIDDLGKYNYKTRVHNNKDWMNTWEKTNYGTQAWTLDPDFYIPGANEPQNPPPPPTPIHPRPHFQNEINYSYNLRKEKCPVCPLEINKPWSQYQSGDSKEPEGFNL